MGNRRSNVIYRKLIVSTEWRKLRASKLKAAPLCERCLSSGIYTQATEVHHRQPIEHAQDERQMEQRAFDPNNLQSLCPTCHRQAHKEIRMMRCSKKAKKEVIKKEAESFMQRFFG